MDWSWTFLSLFPIQSFYLTSVGCFTLNEDANSSSSRAGRGGILFLLVRAEILPKRIPARHARSHPTKQAMKIEGGFSKSHSHFFKLPWITLPSWLNPLLYTSRDLIHLNKFLFYVFFPGILIWSSIDRRMCLLCLSLPPGIHLGTPRSDTGKGVKSLVQKPCFNKNSIKPAPCIVYIRYVSIV